MDSAMNFDSDCNSKDKLNHSEMGIWYKEKWVN